MDHKDMKKDINMKQKNHKNYDNNIKQRQDFFIDSNTSLLKNHLNASFDDDDIKVSEELIAKTLKAINQSKVAQEDMKEITKKKVFPVRRFVSAAAAITILIVGINVVQNTLGNKSFNSEKSGSNNSYNSSAPKDNNMKMYTSDSAPEFSDSDSTGIADNIKDENEATTDNINMTASTDSGVSEGFDTEQQDVDITVLTEDEENGAAEELQKDNRNTSDSYNALISKELKFNELYPFDREMVSNLTITSSTNSVVEIKEETINEFFHIIDEAHFSKGDIDISDNWSYKVMFHIEKGIYTILIGDGIQIQIQKENESINDYYYVEDGKLLLNKIVDFYNNLK